MNLRKQLAAAVLLAVARLLAAGGSSQPRAVAVSSGEQLVQEMRAAFVDGAPATTLLLPEYISLDFPGFTSTAASEKVSSGLLFLNGTGSAESPQNRWLAA